MDVLAGADADAVAATVGWEDEVEAKVVHAMLVDLIEAGNPAIVGENFAMLPQVLGGLLLAFIRTRAGLAAGMAYHAGYNALVLLAAWGTA